MPPTRRDIERWLSVREWDLGNQVLYDLCTRHPHHERAEEVIAKVWLIGRAYSAAVERRRDVGMEVGDRFYTHRVAPALLEPGLDDLIEACRKNPSATAALPAHTELTSRFEAITGQGKISLASKYLHFHVPAAFFIYDSRAKAGLRHLGVNVRVNGTTEYGRFYAKCNALRDQMRAALNREVSTREVDKVLLGVVADRD